jgi:hypothetical protein
MNILLHPGPLKQCGHPLISLPMPQVPCTGRIMQPSYYASFHRIAGWHHYPHPTPVCVEHKTIGQSVATLTWRQACRQPSSPLSGQLEGQRCSSSRSRQKRSKTA